MNKICLVSAKELHADCQVTQEKSLLCTVSLHRKLSILWQRSNSSSTRNFSAKTSWVWRRTMGRSSCISVSMENNHQTYSNVWKFSLCCMWFSVSTLLDAFIYCQYIILKLYFLTVDEEEITFAPTYRFERDTREKYAYTKAKATGVSSCSVRCLLPVRLLSITKTKTKRWQHWTQMSVDTENVICFQVSDWQSLAYTVCCIYKCVVWWIYFYRQNTICPHGAIVSWGSRTLWFMLSAKHMVSNSPSTCRFPNVAWIQQKLETC